MACVFFFRESCRMKLMNKLFSVPLIGIKFLVSILLVWFALAFILDKSYSLAQIFGSFLLSFIALVTIFMFFFKKKFLELFPGLKIVWKIILIAYIICVVYVFVQTAMSIWRMDDKNKTQTAIDFINSQKINLDDVMGKNMPPKPDQMLNDSTIAGIDANNNSIRDDVELAIFAKYPNSAKIRAAELQYAQALQLELTQVFNSETLVVAIKKESYGSICIGETGPGISLEDSREEIKAGLSVNDSRRKEVEDFVINTEIRNKRQTDNLKYMTSYSVPPNEHCDIDLSLLPN